MGSCVMVEFGQCAPGQFFPGQCIFCCSTSCILSGHTPGELLLEKHPIFRGLVPKVGNGDLVGSAIHITGVSATFVFLPCLPSSVYPAFSSQWPVLKALFRSSRLFSCYVCSVLALFHAISEKIILMCSKRVLKDKKDEVMEIVG